MAAVEFMLTPVVPPLSPSVSSKAMLIVGKARRVKVSDAAALLGDTTSSAMEIRNRASSGDRRNVERI